jgi:hypothetical protein
LDFSFFLFVDRGVQLRTCKPVIGNAFLLKSRAMNRRTVLTALPLAALLPEALINAAAAAPATSSTVYELRVYHANEGKLDALLARFRDHTIKIFAKHHMRSIAYWTPTDDPAKTNTLIYILEHPSREAAKTNWKAFEDDEEWKSVRAKSEESGKLVDHVDSTYMALTPFSPHIR